MLEKVDENFIINNHQTALLFNEFDCYTFWWMQMFDHSWTIIDICKHIKKPKGEDRVEVSIPL